MARSMTGEATQATVSHNHQLHTVRGPRYCSGVRDDIPLEKSLAPALLLQKVVNEGADAP